MKKKTFSSITAALASTLIAPAFALEAPADNAPPPPPVDQPADKLPEFKLPEAPVAPPKPEAEAKEESAFLGVVSGEVPELLADHLDLKSGEGIVVRSLVPDGPAAKAGIAVNDVIIKVAGDPVGSPLDMSTRISGHKAGEKVTLDLIHKGKATQLDVTLGVRPAEIAAAEAQPLDRMNLDGFPKELADRVRDAIAGNIGGLDLKIDEDKAQLEQLRKQLQKQMGALDPNAFVPPAANGAGKIRIQGGGKLIMRDPQGSIEVKSADGGKEVTMRDQQGKVTWSGPWDTDQDKAAAPADVQKRMDSLNLDTKFDGNGLRLQMRQAVPLNENEP
jgi:serine protease Do